VPTLADAFRVLAHAYPRWNLTPDAIRTWAALMHDIEPDLVHAAAIQFATESEFPPSVAELRKRALAARGGADAQAIPEAWSEVLRNRDLASRQRYESRPDKRAPYAWSNEAVRIAAEAIGWNREWDSEVIGTTRAQFERYLRELVSKGDVIARAHDALEFAPQVEALMGARPLLPRVNGELA